MSSFWRMASFPSATKQLAMPTPATPRSLNLLRFRSFSADSSLCSLM